MNTTTNTQGVSEAMVERGVAAYRKTTHSMPQTQHDRMRAALEAALSAPEPAAQAVDVDDLAQEIRRVDGNHSLGAGALAEALMPFITRALGNANGKERES